MNKGKTKHFSHQEQIIAFLKSLVWTPCLVLAIIRKRVAGSSEPGPTLSYPLCLCYQNIPFVQPG